jgi:hypothetical protein
MHHALALAILAGTAAAARADDDHAKFHAAVCGLMPKPYIDSHSFNGSPHSHGCDWGLVGADGITTLEDEKAAVMVTFDLAPDELQRFFDSRHVPFPYGSPLHWEPWHMCDGGYQVTFPASPPSSAAHMGFFRCGSAFVDVQTGGKQTFAAFQPLSDRLLKLLGK